MIRPYKTSDLEQIMPLWLETTIAAHPFIDENYWREAKSLVEQQYLPDSETFVYELDGKIVGFISILNNNLLGALFVNQELQHIGIGKALIDYVQLKYPVLLLEVYIENKRAYQFYQNRGFKTIKRDYNPETKAIIATMRYQKI